MKKSLAKLVSVALCACLAGPWMVPASVFAAETAVDSSTATTADSSIAVPADYQRQQLGELYSDGLVAISSQDVKVSKDKATGSLVLTGKKSSLSNTTIGISKTFDFSQNAVGRFSFSGLAQVGKKVILGFYLDGESQPFFQAQLKTQGKSDSWADPAEFSTSIIARNLTGKHTVSIKVLSAPASASFCLDYIEFAESSVPVVSFDIDETLGTVDDMNSSENHSVNCYGTVSIDVPKGCSSVVTGKALKGTSEPLELSYVRGRGNSTWEQTKKPYKIKLESSTDLLGMGKNKHWALLANAYDESLMRNLFSSWLGLEVGMPYTPSMEPVELVMNGQYLGSYLLAENTRLDTNRVDIAKLDDTPDATDEDTISGGYLLSLGNWTLDDDKLNFTTEKAEGVIQIESPDLYSSGNEAQYNYIKNYVQQVEDAIYEGGDYASLMDTTAAANYFWVEELSTNGDGYTSGSCYLYKDRGGKLCWGPLWDFDLAWGSGDILGDPNYATYAHWSHINSFWNGRLFEDQAYVDTVKAQWPAFKAALQRFTDGGSAEKMANTMRTSAAYNYQLWTTGDGEKADVAKATDYFNTSAEQLSSWLRARTNWVDENLSTLDTNPTTVTFKANGKVIKTSQRNIGSYLNGLPTAPKKKGYVFKCWTYKKVTTLKKRLIDYDMTESEYRKFLIVDCDYTKKEANQLIEKLRKGLVSKESANDWTEITKNMTLTATYVKRTKIPKITAIKTLTNTYAGVYIPGKSDYLNIIYQVLPFSITDNKIQLVSSNEDVVKPVDEVSLKIVGAGDAKVTIKPKAGKSRTVKVRIYTEEEAVQAPSDPYLYLANNSITIKKGKYKKLSLGYIGDYTIGIGMPMLTSTDPEIVETGNCGVIHALKRGTAVICYVGDYGSLSFCKVTVK